MSETVYISGTGDCFALYYCRYKFNTIYHYSTFSVATLQNVCWISSLHESCAGRLPNWLCDSFMIRRLHAVTDYLSCIHLKSTITVSFLFCHSNHSNLPSSFCMHATLPHSLPVSDAAVILLMVKHLFCTCLISLIIVFWTMKSDSLDQCSRLHSAFSSLSMPIKHLKEMTLTAMCILTNSTVQPIIMD